MNKPEPTPVLGQDISPKVAKACLEVAREDKKRVKAQGFHGEAPKTDNPTVREWWHTEQQRRIDGCDARIDLYLKASKA